MTTEEIEYIEPSQEHIRQMVEVSNDNVSWSKSKLIALVNEDGFRFVTHGGYWPFPVGWQFARIPRPLTYAERQAKCGLKVGHKVKLLRTWSDKELETIVTCPNKVQEYVGMVGVVYCINDHGLQIEFNGVWWWVPYFVLEKVEPQYREIQCDIGAKVVRINLNNKPTEYILHNIFVDSDGCKFGVVKDLAGHWDVIELCDLRIEVK